MNSIPAEDSLAIDLTKVIKEGDIEKLKVILSEDPGRAKLGIKESEGEVVRSLLHIATDWPGHFPNVGQTICILISHGADPNIGIAGPDTETPLHWAASSNDVDAIVELVKAGSELEAKGSVIAGGAPLENAIGFQNWNAAHALADSGAKTNLGDEAALGHMNAMMKRFQTDEKPDKNSISYAFWNACWAGQKVAARFMFANGADINWVPDWCEDTPLDGAVTSGDAELIQWLTSIGGKRKTTAE